MTETVTETIGSESAPTGGETVTETTGGESTTTGGETVTEVTETVAETTDGGSTSTGGETVSEVTETVTDPTPAVDEVVMVDEAEAAIPTNDEGVLVFPESTTGVGTR
jgi:hypothetical protein